MKTSLCFRTITYLLTGAFLFSPVMSAQAEILPFEIDLAQPSGTEETRFTRTYPGTGDGIGSGNQAIAVADFNDDGFDDMAIGYANYAPPAFPGTSRGRVVIIYGGETSPEQNIDDLTSKTVILNQNDNAQFGYALAAGDVTDDGLPDLVVGAPGARNGKGVVTVLENNLLATPGSSSDVNTDGANPTSGEGRYVGEEAGSSYGTSVLCIDTTGDGAAEIIGGAPNATVNANFNSGKVYVAFGANFVSGTTLDIVSEAEVYTYLGASGSKVGSSLAAGDIDGNATIEIAMGAPGTSAAYVAFNVDPGPNTLDLADSGSFSSITRFTGLNSLGTSMDIGDIDGDRFDDFLLGTPLFTPSIGLEGAGGATAYAGRANLQGQLIDLSTNTTRTFKVLGAGADARYGFSVALGDVTGDGKLDLCIGAPFAKTYSGASDFAGRIAVMSGTYLPSASSGSYDLNTLGPDVALFGAGANTFLGATLNAQGDLDGDGLADLIMTEALAPNGEATGTGRVHTLYGDGTDERSSATEALFSGDTQRIPMGGPLSPVVRASITFSGGDGNTVSATITRSKAGISNLGNALGSNVVPVLWNLSTTRTGWTSAKITLEYSNAEAAGFNENYLALFRAESPDGPWVEVPSATVLAIANRISFSTDTLGYFALISKAPVISLIGLDTITLECPQLYEEQGATATSAANEDLSQEIVITGAEVIDATIPGSQYIVTYNVEDSFGVPAVAIQRFITIEDTNAPDLFLNEGDEVFVECLTEFVDQGATAIDDCEGDITAEIIVGGDIVNPAAKGTYTITYDVSDSNGNSSEQVTRIVTVGDQANPQIELVGEQSITIPCGGVYIEQGATAVDVCDGDLSEEIVISGDTVNTNVAGIYVVNYDVTDSSDNPGGQVSRFVTVEGTCGVPGTIDGCPNDSIFTQLPADANGTGLPIQSEAGNPRVVFEKIDALAAPIGTVTWWGFSADALDAACARPSNNFSISFYDAKVQGNVPGTPLQTYAVSPQTATTGFTDSLGREVIRYTTALNPPMDLNSAPGWISIVGLDSPNCPFSWYFSTVGVDTAATAGIGIDGTPQNFLYVTNAKGRALCLSPATEVQEGEGTPDGEGSVEGAIEGEGAPEGEVSPELECSTGSFFSQPPHANPANANSATSEATVEVAFDNFTNAAQPMGGVQWWGFDTSDRANLEFRINFYSVNGINTAPIRSFVVAPFIEATEITLLGRTVLRYTAELPEVINVTGGWLSIAATSSPAGLFQWYSSPVGDGTYKKTPDDGSAGTQGVKDRAFCFLPPGASEGEVNELLACVDDSAFSQPVYLAFDAAVSTSDTSRNVFSFDRFSGVNEPFSGAIWWGFALNGVIDAECVRDNQDFRIDFYQDNAGQIGTLVDSFNVTAQMIDTGETYTIVNRSWSILRYSASFPTPMNMDSGWISIVGVNESDCAFLWHPSNLGDGHLRGSSPETATSVAGNRAFCLVPSVPQESLLYEFDAADADDDGKASLADIQSVLPDFTENDLLPADYNNDGFLSVPELLEYVGGGTLLSMDFNGDFKVSLSELLRLIQLYNAGGYACAPTPGFNEDGYLARPADGGDPVCVLHAIDQNEDGAISLSELLRAIQFYNLGAYNYCPSQSEDDYCPGAP